MLTGAIEQSLERLRADIGKRFDGLDAALGGTNGRLDLTNEKLDAALAELKGLRQDLATLADELRRVAAAG